MASELGVNKTFIIQDATLNAFSLIMEDYNLSRVKTYTLAFDCFWI